MKEQAVLKDVGTGSKSDGFELTIYLYICCISITLSLQRVCTSIMMTMN